MIKYVEGNIIDLAFAGEIDVLVHGCNCVGKMKKGLAKEIATRCPEAANNDAKWTSTPESKLGNYTFGAVHIPGKDDFFIVVNAYIQMRPATLKEQRNGTVMLDYNALTEVLSKIAYNMSGLRIGLPKIGCGWAGGDWDIVKALISRILKDEDVTIVDFAK